MKKIRCAAFGLAVGAIGFAACEAGSPPGTAVSRPVESEAIAAGVSRPAPSEVVAESEATAAGEVLAAVMRDEDPFARARKLGALLPSLGPGAIPAVKQTLKDLMLPYGAVEVDLLVRFWATHEPAEASRWAVLNSPWNYRVPAILAAFPLWAEADPQAAVAATRAWGMQTRGVLDALQIALVRGWFAANPSEVAQFIKEIGAELDRQHALASFVRIMIEKQGIEAVMRWAESLPGDDVAYKTSAYRQVGSALPLFDQAAGLRWCEAHCDGPYGNNLRNIIARRWVLSDGEAALAWLSTAPEGHEKNLALRAAFAAWGEANRGEALGWMAAQTTGDGEPAPWLRPIFPVYARLLLPDSPAEAIEWAERIEDDEQREAALVRAARAWRQVDEAAAEAWLLKSSLSEEAREKARAPEPMRRRPKR